MPYAKATAHYFERLANVWPVAMSAGVAAWGAKLLDIYSEVFNTDPLLLVIAGSFTILDFIIGIGAAIINRTYDGEKALKGLKKILVYAATITVTVAISNAGNNHAVLKAALGWWDEALLAGILVIEWKSILKTLHGGTQQVRRFFVEIDNVRQTLQGGGNDSMNVVIEEDTGQREKPE